MSFTAWLVCAGWLAVTCAVSLRRGLRGLREGRASLVFSRLRSPTIYLFSAYLLVAALVTPLSPGETASPLLGLSFALPAAYVLATLASVGDLRPSRFRAAALAFLYAGAVLAAAAAILAVASPRFVPAWLR